MNMTRKEIEEMNDTRPFCFETDGEERWYEVGCIDGMEAADTEPDISELWHDWPDMPKTGEKIIGETIWGDAIVFRFDSAWFSGNFLKRWAYLDDLL